MSDARAEALERIAGPPATPAVPHMIQAAVAFEGCGREIAAGLALVKLRERYDQFSPGDLPADERTWRAFVTKHLPFGPERAAQLIGRLIHLGAMLRCQGCGAEAQGRCA